MQSHLSPSLTSPDSQVNTPRGLSAEMSHKVVKHPSPSIMGKRKRERAAEREKTRRKGKAFVSQLERGRKAEEKKNIMSTVKRPRGRVSELL